MADSFSDTYHNDRAAELKAILTVDYVVRRVRGAYTNWHYGPEPVVTASELAAGVYEDCGEERAFSSVVTPHVRRILDKLTREGVLAMTHANVGRRQVRAYTAVGFENPNKVRLL